MSLFGIVVAILCGAMLVVVRFITKNGGGENKPVAKKYNPKRFEKEYNPLDHM